MNSSLSVRLFHSESNILLVEEMGTLVVVYTLPIPICPTPREWRIAEGLKRLDRRFQKLDYTCSVLKHNAYARSVHSLVSEIRLLAVSYRKMRFHPEEYIWSLEWNTRENNSKYRELTLPIFSCPLGANVSGD